MTDIKQKFMEILFSDSDEEEVVAQAPITDVNPKVEPKKNDSSSYKAADIMYKKPAGQSVFIDANSTGNVSAKKLFNEEEKEEEYVLSPQLSPIFGVIDNAGSAVNVEPTRQTKAQVKKPEDVHLDIVPSPIYGYGNKEVNNHDFDEETYINKDIHHIFQEDVDDETMVVDQEINLFEDFEDYK